MIGIIDYGMGNLRSVANAFHFLAAEVHFVTHPADLQKTRALVLPGVGAFGNAMDNLRHKGFIGPLEEAVLENGKPFLGICLGMQLLATTGLEHGEHAGLGWVPGVVEKISNSSQHPAFRLPHIGWNDVRFTKRNGMYAGLDNSAIFYFVHSYHFKPVDAAVVSGTCDYGVEFTASIESGNIMATQFHPEKSQQVGLAVLRNFLQMVN